MPIKNGQGHSDMTVIKEQQLGVILGTHLNICKAVFAGQLPYLRVYHYLDLYAGCGLNQEEQCSGSPMLFLAMATLSGLPFRAWFIEKNQTNAEALQQTVLDYDLHPVQVSVLQGDCSQMAHVALRNISRNVFGMIYADPNGIPDFGLLADLSRQYLRLDILIRLGATFLKRCRRAIPGWEPLTYYMAQIRKKVWLVQSPLESDHNQWTFLLGTNYPDYRTMRNIRFYRTDTPEGRDALT